MISGDQSEGISGDSVAIVLLLLLLCVSVIVMVGVLGCAISSGVGCFLISLLKNIACLSRAMYLRVFESAR